MTRAMQLTPAELREAIAKVKGYIRRIGWMDAACINPTDYWLTPGGGLTTILPEWPENISDAMKLEEEVSHTTLKDRERYIHMLEYVVGHHPDTCYVESEIEGWFKIDPFYLIHATAEQRCRAWLMWKEGKNEC